LVNRNYLLSRFVQLERVTVQSIVPRRPVSSYLPILFGQRTDCVYMRYSGPGRALSGNQVASSGQITNITTIKTINPTMGIAVFAM